METEILNILYDISYAKTRQINNVYLYDDNLVFECTPLDVSNNYDISLNFLKYLESPGFIDVSAVATLDISATILNDIFLFQDSNNINEEFVYGINNMTNKNLNILFSQAKITKKYLNNEILNITLVDDYIESIVETITNSVSIKEQSIIKNVKQLREGLSALDPGFCIKLNRKFDTYYDSSLSQIPKTLNTTKQPNVMDIACKNLISGLLSFTQPLRIAIFFEDLKKQTPPYSFVFHSGDIIAIKITYIPLFKVADLNDGYYKFYPRSYKIFLKVE
jgi:hypothetical protein